jgi:cell division protein DivIC
MDKDKNRRFKWIPQWLNIPFIIFIAFIVLLLFFGDNNYLKNNSYKKQINELKAEIKANEDSSIMYDGKVRELNTDRETLEKIAREKYGMKRVNEDVYITDIP